MDKSVETMTLFEAFLDYCDEDNPKLKDDIKTWLADYFDISHRVVKISEEELEWIKKNLRPVTQLEIFGKVVISNE